MPRIKGVNGRVEILKALAEADRPLSIREIQERTGRNWNAIWYWLRDGENKNNLVKTGCVVELRKKDYTTNRAQDEYVYALSKYGRKYCIQDSNKDD